MSPFESSCELPNPSPSAAGSRVLRFRPDFRWDGVPAADYKPAAEHWSAVTRVALVGEGGESTAFHVRYFELAPGGFTTLEQHAHEHCVVVLRGRGQVHLGKEVHDLAFGDTVYVAPHAAHQFRNPSSSEPFGFLCIVDAQRDRPLPVQDRS
jgi:quercetin dioxygenase-like cupin family protein